MSILTTREAADRLRTTPKTIRRMINSGYLPAVRFGATTRIDSSVLDNLLGTMTSNDTTETEVL